MALVPDGVEPREDVTERFGIAQEGKPTEEQKIYQKNLKLQISSLADDLNHRVADSREKSLAITHLEEALMWAGKAIFR